MGLFNSIRMGSSAAGAYEIERSIRNDQGTSDVNSGSNFEHTYSSAGNQKTFTISVWVKTCNVPGNIGDDQYSIFSTGGGGSGAQQGNLFIRNDACLQFSSQPQPSPNAKFITTRKFRDFSAWYHIVVAVDTTQATQSNRVKIYVNGVQETDFSTETYPSQNADLQWNHAVRHRVGSNSLGSNLSHTYGNFNGYIAEFNFIDGSALTPSSFAETDTITGQWNPKKYIGSYGTNGFYLNFSDNSGATATTLGKDSSGNGNNFTPNNYATTDAVKDTPTNNFCIMNRNDNNLSEASPHFAYSEGNLKASWSFSGTNFDRAYGTLFIEPSDTNKYYWEATGTQNNEQMQWGIVATDTAAYRANNRNTNPTKEANIAIAMWQPYIDNGIYAIDNSGGTYGDKLTLSNGAPANGDIFSFVYDAAAGKFYVFFKGVEPTGQNYSAGTTLFDTLDTSKTYALHNCQGDGGTSTKSGNFIMNWGQDSSFAGAHTAQGNTDANGIGDFYYSVPSGAKALCTANLPDPAILLPNKHFDTLTWAGDGSANRSITGLQFEPDWTWIKNRSQASTHSLQDSVIGFGDDKTLRSDTTGGLDTNGNLFGYINNTLSNGVSLNAGSSASSSRVNSSSSGATHVGWFWNAGGTTVTNNNGSISSQVRANTSAGFSIVTYTGDNASATVGHGLGVAPNVVIVKRRDGTGDWIIGHDGLASNAFSNNKFQKFAANSTFTNSLVWGSQPTSTVVQIVTGSGATNLNGSSNTYVMYCFSEVAGYSKFGLYRGNQRTKGTFIFTGFRPALVITKGTWGGNWNMYDNTRNPFNVANKTIYPNLNNAESTESSSGNQMDLLSNGFKLRGSNNDTNHDADFVFLAFAESPFKYSRAR